MRGLGVTLQLATIGTVLGCVLGFVVGMVRSVNIDKHSSVVSQTILRILKAIIAVYVEVIRGTPLMVQATVIYYGTMSIWGLDIPSFSAGILGTVPAHRCLLFGICARRHRRISTRDRWKADRLSA